jgi:hypothetical protein
MFAFVQSCQNCFSLTNAQLLTNAIRSDEQRRITKIENRIDEAQENQGKSLFNQPHGESIFAPLVDGNITCLYQYFVPIAKWQFAVILLCF